MLPGHPWTDDVDDDDELERNPSVKPRRRDANPRCADCWSAAPGFANARHQPPPMFHPAHAAPCEAPSVAGELRGCLRTVTER
jgi:hypothetical protein